MDYQITQRTRSLLQTRTRRVKGSGVNQYAEQLRFLLKFIESNPIFKAAQDNLIMKASVSEDRIKEILESGEGHDFQSETDYIACAYFTLKQIAFAEGGKETEIAIRRAAVLVDGGGEIDLYELSEAPDKINDYLLEHFYDYLDENVDNRNSILMLLQKYKQRCEWFQGERMRAIASEGIEYGRTGERGLMSDMYEYLHLAGMDFHIEPQSSSGQVDLIVDQSDEDRIILEGKYLKYGETDPKVRSKIIGGFRQVYDYCCDFNSKIGYLVTFNELGKSLGIESLKSDGFDYCDINGKMIYFINVDIHNYETSASKRGRLEVISLPEKDLVKEIK